MTKKEKNEIIEELYKLTMRKILPERTVIFKGFVNGKQVELGRIIYKAGGFEVKKRIINK